MSSNFLSGYVGKLLLLDEDNNSVYSSLTHLNLSNAEFGELVQAARWNKLPSLKSLDISCNKLSGIMQDFKQNSFPRLEKLNLSSIHLNKDDVKHLANALVDNSLQNLKCLNLTGNVLRGSLQELFGDQFIPSLKALILSETHLNEQDLVSLSNAIQQGKLPQLDELSLLDNNFRGIEGALENFLKSCAKYFKRKEVFIRLSLDDVSDPQSFEEKVNNLVQNTKITISLRKTDSSSMRFEVTIPVIYEPGKQVYSWPVRF